MPAKPRRYTVRSSSSTLGFVLGAVVLLVLLVVPVVVGQWRLLGFVLAPALLFAWTLWIVLYRPAVQYDDRTVVIVNIGRVHVLPWARVQRIRQRFSLEFELDDARKPLQAWGVQPPRRSGNIASNFDRKSRTAPDPDRYVRVLEGFREGAAPSDEPVSTRWDLVPLLIGAVLVVAVIVEIVVGV